MSHHAALNQKMQKRIKVHCIKSSEKAAVKNPEAVALLKNELTRAIRRVRGECLYICCQSIIYTVVVLSYQTSYVCTFTAYN